MLLQRDHVNNNDDKMHGEPAYVSNGASPDCWDTSRKQPQS